MSKAVLVMEMPESCEKCPLLRYDVVSRIGCAVTCNIVLRKVGEKKPKWCPLRPMPEKVTETLDDGSFMDGSDYGWNECIEAVEGSREDEAFDSKK